MNFLSNVVCISAALLLMAGSVAIFLGVLALTSVSWQFVFGWLLIPVWMAAMIEVMEWATDLT